MSSKLNARAPDPHRVGLLGAASRVVPALIAVAAPSASAGASTNQWAPAHAGDFPDPSVMLYNGVYYGFSTQNFAPMSQIINIQTSTSTDGVNWTSMSNDALPHLGAWAKQGNTWAPSVAYNGTEFVMYYAATEAASGDQCIGLAISTAGPLGPYVDSSPMPVVCQTGRGGSIDPDIFVAPGGAATLIWKSDGDHIGVPTDIWAAPLTGDLLTLTGTASELLTTDQNWQGAVIEGPDMVDYDGSYYLFYSGGDYGSSAYSIGYAVCANLTSLCTDSSINPILTSQSGMSGPGGPDVFMSPSGQPEMAFAAWQGNTIGYLACGIRPMYLANVDIPTPGVVTLSPSIISSAAPSPSCAPPPPPPGYWQVASDGGIFTFGTAQFYGSTGSLHLNKPVVGMAATPDHRGYWLVASDGGIFAFGDAQFWGSTGAIHLNQPIVGMVPTLDGKGYWLVASDGGIFAFGDAPYYGSLGGESIGYPITAMAPGYLGGGYWLVDGNGQVFSFGDAKYEGQPSEAPGGYRITGMSSSPDSNGYWLASANGNVASEGDAAPYGSLIGHTLNAPIVGMSTTPDGAGYWLQGSDGGIFTFGDADFLGSMGGKHLNAPMVGIADS